MSSRFDTEELPTCYVGFTHEWDDIGAKHHWEDYKLYVRVKCGICGAEATEVYELQERRPRDKGDGY